MNTPVSSTIDNPILIECETYPIIVDEYEIYPIVVESYEVYPLEVEGYEIIGFFKFV